MKFDELFESVLLQEEILTPAGKKVWDTIKGATKTAAKTAVKYGALGPLTIPAKLGYAWDKKAGELAQKTRTTDNKTTDNKTTGNKTTDNKTTDNKTTDKFRPNKFYWIPIKSNSDLNQNFKNNNLFVYLPTLNNGTINHRGEVQPVQILSIKPGTKSNTFIVTTVKGSTFKNVTATDLYKHIK